MQRWLPAWCQSWRVAMVELGLREDSQGTGFKFKMHLKQRRNQVT
ncbi:hypothetical protein LEMLEM_LOCUS12628 [Lemmus lemmus]